MKMTIELPDSAKIIHVVTIIGDKRTDFTCHTEFPKEGRTIRLKDNGHWEVKDNGRMLWKLQISSIRGYIARLGML